MYKKNLPASLIGNCLVVFPTHPFSVSMHLHFPQEYQPGDLLLSVDLSRQPITSRQVFSSLYIFSLYVIINVCRKEYKKKTIHKCSYDNSLRTHARTHARTPPPHHTHTPILCFVRKVKISDQYNTYDFQNPLSMQQSIISIISSESNSFMSLSFSASPPPHHTDS